jgi:hypothetical protein
LETLFPTLVTAVSFQGADGSVAINIESDIKMSAAQLIMNVKSLDYVTNVNIPVMNEVDKVYKVISEGMDDDEAQEEHKIKVWSYTITFKLKDAPLDEYKAQ